jgi:hypothetical protein
MQRVLLSAFFIILSAAGARCQDLSAISGIDGYWTGTMTYRDPSGGTTALPAALRARLTYDGMQLQLLHQYNDGQRLIEQTEVWYIDRALNALVRATYMRGEEHRYEFGLKGLDDLEDPLEWMFVRTRRGYAGDAWKEYRYTDQLEGDRLVMTTEGRNDDGEYALVSRLDVTRRREPPPVEFRLAGYEKALVVSVRGDFNSWSVSHTPMRRDADGWYCTVPLPPGTWRYVFEIDGTHIPDPLNDRTAEAGEIGRASVLLVR